MAMAAHAPIPAVRYVRRARLSWVMGWMPPTASVCQGGGVELPPKEASMEQTTTIGLDIAKRVSQAHGADVPGTCCFESVLLA